MKVGEPFNPYRHFCGIFIPNAMLRWDKMTHAEKIVYGRLLQYAGERGVAFPKQETLAEEVCLQRRQVQIILSRLEELKLIFVKRPEGVAKWAKAANRYGFLWHEVFEQALAHSNAHAVDSTHAHSNALGQAHSNALGYIEENQIEENQNNVAALAATAIDKRFAKMAKQLSTSLSKLRKINTTPAQLKQWEKQFARFAKSKGYDRKRLQAALAWYCEQLPLQYGEKYFLQIFSAGAFVEKFDRLEALIESSKKRARESSDNPDDPMHDDSGISGGGTKVVEDRPMTPEESKRFWEQHERDQEV